MLEKLPSSMRRPIGLALGSAFFALSILAVLASVVTLMRWFQLSWLPALVGAFLVSLIPYAGRPAYFGLALIGLYYLADAGFDFSRAVGPFID